MDFHNLDFIDGLVISAFSMLVVFVVLLIISYMVDLTALLTRVKKKEDKTLPAPVPAEDPLEDPGARGRTLAAIMGALSAMGGGETSFIIRKIKAQEGPLSAWEAEGLRENIDRRPS